METIDDILSTMNKLYFKTSLTKEEFGYFENIRKILIDEFSDDYFHKNIPATRMVTVLSIIDDIILKIFSKELEGIQNDMCEVRENVMYMLDFERVVKEESVDEN